MAVIFIITLLLGEYSHVCLLGSDIVKYLSYIDLNDCISILFIDSSTLYIVRSLAHNIGSVIGISFNIFFTTLL